MESRAIDVNLLTKKLDDSGQLAAAHLFANPAMRAIINEAWNSGNTVKISWKVFAAHAKNCAISDITKADKNGYHSIVFLDTKDGLQPFLIDKLIKAGGKAKLKNAYNLATGEHVALKVAKGFTTDEEDREPSEEYTRERTTLNELGRMHGARERKKIEGQKRYLAQDFIKGMDLSDYVRTLSQKVLYQTDTNVGNIAWLGYCATLLDIMELSLEQLHQLHASKFTHRDIKLLNFMVCENLHKVDDDHSTIARIILIDFGSTDKQGGEPRTPHIGTKLFFAPELNRPDQDEKVAFTQATDMFALGASLKEVYGLLCDPKFKLFFRRKKLAPEYGKLIDNLSGVINGMTQLDPDRRITAATAIQQLTQILQDINQTLDLKINCLNQSHRKLL